MAGVLAIAPFVFLDGNFDPANLPQSAWVQVWGFAFAAWTLARIDRAGASPADLPLALLIAWGAVTLAWATSRGDAVPVLLEWMACGAWFLAVSRSVTRTGEVRTLALALFASGAAVAVIGLAQHFFGLAVFYQAFPPAATFVNKNIATQYVAATLPLGLAVWAVGQRPTRAAWAPAAAIAGVVMLAFLGVARTRSSFVAIAVEIVVVGWLMVPARRRLATRAVLAAIAIGAIALAAALAVRPRAPSSPFTSVQARQAIWSNTVAMIADAPLHGVGVGNHAVHYPAYARRIAVDEILSANRQLDHVHNDPLQLAAETGLVGISLAGWLALRGLRLWRVAAPHRGRSPLLLAWIACAAGLLADSLFSFPMQRALPPVVLAVGLGSMAALAGIQPGPGRVAARALAALAAAATVVVAIHQWHAIAADRHVRKMIAAESRSFWPGVEEESTAALVLAPRNPQALFGLGTAELARGRLPEARAALRRLLAEHPHDLPALGNLALTQMAAHEDAAALETWGRVLAIDPRDPRAQRGRAEVLARMAVGRTN